MLSMARRPFVLRSGLTFLTAATAAFFVIAEVRSSYADAFSNNSFSRQGNAVFSGSAVQLSLRVLLGGDAPVEPSRLSLGFASSSRDVTTPSATSIFVPLAEWSVSPNGPPVLTSGFIGFGNKPGGILRIENEANESGAGRDALIVLSGVAATAVAG